MERTGVDQSNLRPEARLEDPAHGTAGRGGQTLAPASGATPAVRPDGNETVRENAEQERTPVPATAAAAQKRRQSTWTEPDVAERPASFAIYRPETGDTTREPTSPRIRTEAQ